MWARAYDSLSKKFGRLRLVPKSGLAADLLGLAKVATAARVQSLGLLGTWSGYSDGGGLVGLATPSRSVSRDRPAWRARRHSATFDPGFQLATGDVPPAQAEGEGRSHRDGAQQQGEGEADNLVRDAHLPQAHGHGQADDRNAGNRRKGRRALHVAAAHRFGNQ